LLRLRTAIAGDAVFPKCRDPELHIAIRAATTSVQPGLSSLGVRDEIRIP
jgi:hypothetical protein